MKVFWNKALLTPFILLLAMLGVLGVYYSEVIKHPNGYLFSQVGDGLKNYFVFGYYLKFDHGLSFTGFNYPYGESLLLTDSHPLYAWFLKAIDQHFFDLSSYGVGILNLSMLAGMAISGLVIYLILKSYQLPDWYAGFIAFCLFLLAPQWARIQGHLSLSYAFVIPVFWYLLIRLERSKQRWMWVLLYVFSGLILGGIHMYYLGIFAVFTFGYGLAKAFITASDRWPRMSIIGQYLFIAVFPLIFYLSLSEIVDPVEDRPQSPYGFYVYYATLGSVFLPEFSTITRVLSEIAPPRIHWEGRAFVGIPSVLFCLSVLGLIFRSGYVGSRVMTILENRELNVFLVASILALLFSMCIPFRWGLHFITDVVKPLNQFRALGRFSWIFFYVVNVATAYYLYAFFQWGKEKDIALISSTVTFLLLFIWLSDSYAHFLTGGVVPVYANDKLEADDVEFRSRLESSGHSANDFQGIMALPVVSIRTDKLLLAGNMTGYNEALKASYHTGIPVIQSTASRPSFSQSHSAIQLISDPLIRKTRLEDMDDRPLLLLLAKGSELEEQEKHLIQQSIKFWEDDFISLHSLPLSAFKDQIQETKSRFLTLRDSLDHTGDLYCEPDCDQIIFRGYDGQVSATVFQGEGSLSSSRELVLFDSTYTGFPASISFWVYIDPSYSGMPVYQYWYGEDVAQLESSGPVEFRNGTDIIDNWLRVSFPLIPADHHRILLKGKKITVDNLVISPNDADFYLSENDNLILYNNFPMTDR